MNRFPVLFRVFLLLLLALCTEADQRVDAIASAALRSYGQRAASAVRDWGRQLDAVAGLPDLAKVQRVNAYFNGHLDFAEDRDVWARKDFWATPMEFLAKGAGDCEDFAIAKYASLRMLGVAEANLKLIYVVAKVGGPHSTLKPIEHMVLGYYPDPAGDPLVLDNLVDEVRSASSRPDLAPWFFFSAEGQWSATALAPNDPATVRSQWRAALARMMAQGFEFAK